MYAVSLITPEVKNRFKNRAALMCILISHGNRCNRPIKTWRDEKIPQPASSRKDKALRYVIPGLLAILLCTFPAVAQQPQLSDLIADHDELATDHHGLATDHDELATDHDELTTGHNGLITDHDGLTIDHDGLATDHDGLINDHGNLTSSHNELMIDHENLTSAHNGLMTHHEHLMINHENLITNQDELINDHGNLTTDHHALGHKLDRLQAAVDAIVAGQQRVFPGDGVNGPPLRYVDNGDRTTTDLHTGLMWEQKQSGRGIHGVDATWQWSDAGSTQPDSTAFTVFLDTLNNKCDDDEKTSCTTAADCATGVCGFAGHRDWRLPNVKELISIVDYGQRDPAISPRFPGEPFPSGAIYWTFTSVVDPDNPAFVWVIGFTGGQNFITGKAAGQNRAIAVRGGP